MIQVKSLTKDYGPRRAIDKMNFQADKGEILGFLGPNGAGKTTTMRIVRFRISSMDGHTIEVLKDEEGLWELVEPVEEQGDSARIESGLTTIAELRLITKLETDLDKKIIGLDPPVNEGEIESETGEKITAFTGDLAPTGGGYYAIVEGETLTVVDSFGIDRIIEFIANPPIIEIPSPSPPP